MSFFTVLPCARCGVRFTGAVAEARFEWVGRIARERRTFCWPCWADYPERLRDARYLVDTFAAYERLSDLFAEVTRVASGAVYLALVAPLGLGPSMSLFAVPFATACARTITVSSLDAAARIDWRWSDHHAVEAAALARLGRELAVTAPTVGDLIHRIDWPTKRRLREENKRRRDAEISVQNASRAQEARALAEQHDATMLALEHARDNGLECPNCAASHRTFRISRMRNTALICPSCSRSFHIVQPIPPT